LVVPSVFGSGAFGALGLGFWDAGIIYSDNTTITFVWDVVTDQCPVNSTCGYQLELRHLELSYVDKYVINNLLTNTKTISYKRSGHYQVFMCSFTIEGQNPPLCSDWTNSISSGMVVIGVQTPINKPWILYWRQPAPTGGGIK
jgi:hypothetical protein